ncbi:hypothetical protein [Robertkochia marina]|nr:hypothetical protein [Robertkochia marina]
MKKRTIYLAILLGFILALFMIDCDGEENEIQETQTEVVAPEE